MAYPHPGCFLQEWQTKGLGLTRLVRVATAGLKVVLFSASCRWLVRVARKGVSGGKLGDDSLELKGQTSEELNAETLRACR